MELDRGMKLQDVAVTLVGSWRSREGGGLFYSTQAKAAVEAKNFKVTFQCAPTGKDFSQDCGAACSFNKTFE